MTHDFRFIQALVTELLDDLDGIPGQVKDSLRGNILAGEPEITFEAICSWIDELDLGISSEFYEKLKRVACLLGTGHLEVESLRAHIE